ncbi:hypothetical protein BCR34DRAFT_472464, partial [Clohesyomyces aquaticus]
EAVYDAPWSYCDIRYKVAGQCPTPPQFTGIPKIMATSKTIRTEVVSSQPDSIIFKSQQEYIPRPTPIAKKVNSQVTLTLYELGKVRYHKDTWNEMDYSHGGLGETIKTLNGDHLIKITRPPDNLLAGHHERL